MAEILSDRAIASGLPVTAIYCSPSLRARQTVQPLATQLGLSICIEEDLRERPLGKHLGDIAAFRAAVRATWQDPTFCLPGGETNLAAQSRGIAVLARLRRDHPGGHIVVATHGNLMALVLQHFDNTIDFGFWSALTMPDIYRLRWYDTGHAEFVRLWS